MYIRMSTAAVLNDNLLVKYTCTYIYSCCYSLSAGISPGSNHRMVAMAFGSHSNCLCSLSLYTASRTGWSYLVSHLLASVLLDTSAAEASTSIKKKRS